MGRLIIFSVFVLIGVSGYAQQLPQYTQYMWHQYAYNPAYAGMERSLSVSGLIRSQWSQFPGSPKTQLVYGHIPLYFLNGSAGVRLMNEQLGPSRRVQMDFSYNYVQSFNGVLVSAALRAGAQQFSLTSSDLRTPSGQYLDGLIAHNDPFLEENLTIIKPTIGIGSFVRYKGLEVGLSVENLISFAIRQPTFVYSTSPHWHLFGQYSLYINELVTIKPSFLLKSDGVRTQLDIGAMAVFDKFEAGLFIRDPNRPESLNILAGAKVSKNVRIFYSFDIGLSPLATNHDGTHEFSVNYNLNRPIKTGELPKIIYNPRFN